MTTCLGKSCLFGLPRVPFVNCCQFMYLVISLLVFEGRMWDLIVSVPDHCLSFYFSFTCLVVVSLQCAFTYIGDIVRYLYFYSI